MVRDIPLSLVVSFGSFWLHWRYELPCQDKLPEFHYTPISGCIRVLWLTFHPLGLGLDKALFGWNSVRCRWVFKVKHNCVYHARLEAKGFSQIPGMDFTDNYSPVVNDVTFRLVVARMLIENLKGK